MLRGRASVPAQGGDPQADITVAELLDAYFVHADKQYERDGRTSREAANLADAAKPVARLYGSTPACEFGPLALDVVRQEWITQDVSRGVINGRVNRVRRMSKGTVSRELIPVSVHERLRTLEPIGFGRRGVRETPPVVPVPQEQIDAVLAIAPPIIATMIRLQIYAGTRPGEVVQMRRRDIDTSESKWR